jgi:hypothetical protein
LLDPGEAAKIIYSRSTRSLCCYIFGRCTAENKTYLYGVQSKVIVTLSIILRIIGLLCLGGVGIAGASWWNTDKIMNPVRKEVVISVSRVTTLVFTPNQEVSERDYVVRLYFENTPELLRTCDDVKLLGVQWMVGTSEIVQSWNALENKNYSCESQDNLTVASFLAPSFKPYTNYYFHLSTTNKTWNGGNVKVIAAIQHPDGIGTHYLFMDKALAELLGGGLLLVSLICFVTDFLIIFLSRKLPERG